MNDKMRGTAEMSAAMTISGTIGWFVIQSGQPVLDVVFWRCAFGAIALLIVCRAMGLLKGIASPRKVLLAALGGVFIVLNWVLLFSAFPHASISIATCVYSTQPFMLVALGALFLGERLTFTKLAWLALAFGGMVLIVQAKPQAAYVGQDYLIGILLALSAAFLYALAALLTKKLTGTPPHLIAFIQVCVGVVMLAPMANLSTLPSGARNWAMLATLGIVHTGLMFVLLYGAIQKLPTALTGSLSFIYPVVAILVDFVAFDTRLHPAQFVGAAIILLSAAAMNLGWSFGWPLRSRKGSVPTP